MNIFAVCFLSSYFNVFLALKQTTVYIRCYSIISIVSLKNLSENIPVERTEDEEVTSAYCAIR